MVRVSSIIISILIMTTTSVCSQQTGNIVEIFGRDKVETTSEGIVVHEFTDGYALPDAMRPGILTGMQDIVFWQMVTERFERPYDGKILRDNYQANPHPLRWKHIEADSTGFFRGDLRRAYVYTEFDSPQETLALLEATGHTRVFINGMPHDGDHYDYGHTLIPFILREGPNQFVYTYGRFGRVASKIVIPEKELQFSPRDMTLPSLIPGETESKWGAVRIVNASESMQTGLYITCLLESGESASHRAGQIMPMAVRKLKFQIPAMETEPDAEKVVATLLLMNDLGEEVDRMDMTLNVHDAGRHHERTFISSIDGSVQYFSVAPSTSAGDGQALVLSVHGASVEATNQTRAYRQKDWAHIVAPTNRRPFGFNWEEWGRLDALEVLHEARQLFRTDTAQTYLTGHSMGGHGAWFLGATYPDKWAAIAPAAGYADIIGYRRTDTDSLIRINPHFEMVYRGAKSGRTLDLATNYIQSGVYVLHGSADAVVPVEQARMMRRVLSEFHPNFSYFEYPGGSHWYGDHSMDWPPLFSFLKQNTIPKTKDVKQIEFITASPGVSANNYWLRINQQQKSYELSKADFRLTNDSIAGNTENIESITFITSKLHFDSDPVIVIDGQSLRAEMHPDITLKLNNGQWHIISEPAPNEKNPERYGSFKLAFTNNVLFVYATGGDDETNAWYKNKARFDAETFLYRGNGSIDVIPDRDFDKEKFKDRNVIIYGNADNNKAWHQLLNQAPVKVSDGAIYFGDKVYRGDNLGAYFIYPRPDSQTAAVGVVGGTGHTGMKAIYANDYFSGITGFPDLLIFSTDWIKDGVDGIKVSGFFGNDWGIDTGDFISIE